jgi:hypothetical protein
MESAFHEAKAAIEMNLNEFKEHQNDSNHQNTPNTAYSDQNVKNQNITHKKF